MPPLSLSPRRPPAGVSGNPSAAFPQPSSLPPLHRSVGLGHVGRDGAADPAPPTVRASAVLSGGGGLGLQIQSGSGRIWRSRGRGANRRVAGAVACALLGTHVLTAVTVGVGRQRVVSADGSSRCCALATTAEPLGLPAPCLAAGC